VLGIRPEHLEDAELTDAGEGARLRGDVVLREALGSELVVHLRTDARPAATDEVRELAEDAGSSAPAESNATLVGRLSPRSRVREGQPIELAVETSELHFFNPRTGLGIYADNGKGAPT
jgi:multiple sugar transport system ATP-binding protein